MKKIGALRVGVESSFCDGCQFGVARELQCRVRAGATRYQRGERLGSSGVNRPNGHEPVPEFLASERAIGTPSDEPKFGS
jgi:hypothetical protein